MMKNSGYLVINRKIDEWEYLSEPLAYALWNHLLRLAAWKDKEDLKRGELLISIRELSKISGIDRAIVSKWLAEFERAGQIAMKQEQKKTRITLLNYEKYNARLADKSANKSSKNSKQENGLAEISANIGGNISQSSKTLAEISANIGGNISQCPDDPSLFNRNKETYIETYKHNSAQSKKICSTPKAEVEAVILNDGSEWLPTEKEYEEYIRLYPAVDIKQEFRKMRGWCNSNPKKRKTIRGVERFVNGWLSRAQDSGRPQEEEKEELPF